jgi:hypothetical protein
LKEQLQGEKTKKNENIFIGSDARKEKGLASDGFLLRLNEAFGIILENALCHNHLLLARRSWVRVIFLSNYLKYLS